MSINLIEADFRDKISREVELAEVGNGRFRVFTPFRFDDGDHLSIVLKKEGPQWVLTDEGHTFMHLSYTIDEADLKQGSRRKVIDRAISSFNVTDREGELRLPIEGENYGSALFSYAQALLQIADVSYLNRETVRSTFMDDFRKVIMSSVRNEQAVQFDWCDPEGDPSGKYPVDCRLKGRETPLFVFGIANNEKCNVVTLVVQHFKMLNARFNSLVIYQDQEAISRKPLARLTDVVDKQFSRIEDNKRAIADYIGQAA
jgi:hypothetical protein